MDNSNSKYLGGRLQPRTTFGRGAFQLSICLALIASGTGSHLFAEEVYNNFSITPVNGWWGAGPAGLPDEDVGPVRTAQQFMLNGNDTVTDVALQMSRRAAPRGRVDFEIWEDEGSGVPGRKVGMLGSVEDIGAFPVEIAATEGAETFEEFLGLPRDLASVTFDTVVSGLNPELPHYVVLDYTEASGDFPANFGWTITDEADGTNGAQGSMITTEFPLFEDFLGDKPFDGGDWIQTRQLFPEHQFFKMSLNAADSSIPSLGDFDDNGELTVADVDSLNAAIAMGSTESLWDLNTDEIVDRGDLSFWVAALKSTWIGDANLDGEFNSTDFTEVFQAGKYESGELARWNQGDWNADERFDSSDFIAAFQDAGYEMGARSAVAAVPEPSSCVLLSLGLLSVGRIRRR